MFERIFEPIVTIATAITGIAIIAVLVSRNAQTGSVIQAATGGFAQDIAAAVSPVTGGSSGGFGSGISSYGGYTGQGGVGLPGLM